MLSTRWVSTSKIIHLYDQDTEKIANPFAVRLVPVKPSRVVKSQSFNSVQRAHESLQSLRIGLAPFLVGKEALGEVLLCGLLSSGHILFEDIPGIGKTTLIKALAKLVGVPLSRIQCTSDLLPSDILGIEAYSAERDEFKFHPGPIFANFILVDELNRTSPRTQSALLEAMAEGVVTINRKAYALSRPFLVFATQNPSDYLGTYALPESQLDRFAAKIRLSYPADTQERKIFTASALDPLSTLAEGQLGSEIILQLQSEVEKVFVSERVVDYVRSVVEKTRHHDALKLGVSTRGGVIWLRMARARAILHGRDFVTPDDLLILAIPCLAHRITARSTGADAAVILDSILSTVDIE